jgi:deoxyribonuclease V
MQDSPQHRWDVTPEEAIEIQQQLRGRVQLTNGFDPAKVRTIAGIDASYRDMSRAAVVVLSFPELHVVDSAIAVRATTFPYVPGLLSFREAPAVLDAMEKLSVRPNLIMCDGQGIAHPRRLGIASHLGVYLDLPSIGCAKSRLVGVFKEPGQEPGDRSPLRDRGELVGMVLRSKPRTNPLFISPGHKIDVETAVEFVVRCLRGYRLPEPTRAAHNLADSAAKGTLEEFQPNLPGFS